MKLGRPNTNRQEVGLMALLKVAGHTVPSIHVRHYASGTARHELHLDRFVEITINRRDAPKDIRGHLEYAVRREALDLRVWHALCEHLGPDPFVAWFADEPNGKHARRACHLYEGLTGSRLQVSDTKTYNYSPLANSELQLTTPGIKEPRFRIIDNLLGSFKFCPLVRNSEALRTASENNLALRLGKIVATIEPSDLRRATDYLYHKETKASFLIEREDVSLNRMERFVGALRSAGHTKWYREAQLVALQNSIVEPRYAEPGFRSNQVYVGQTLPWGEEKVHYACPKAEDVPSLMKGWLDCLYRTVKMNDPVCQAAVLGFGFVFIHPFEDGNGRIHRFVIHATLARREFAPEGVVVPVSATMLRRQDRYDQALDAFSKPLMEHVEFRLDHEGVMTVDNDTAPLYRYWDATEQCEYLYEALREAIEVDLPEELRALKAYDAGRAALLSIVDMPDRKADLLMSLLLQNNYRISARKRVMFSELTDEEMRSIESAVKEAAETIDLEGLQPALDGLA